MKREELLTVLVKEMHHIARHMWLKETSDPELTEFKDRFNRQQKALLHMLFHQNSMSMGQIADQLNTTQGAVTQQVEGLIEKGILKKNHDEKDRRIVRISFTEEGLKQFNIRHAKHLAFLQKNVFNALTEEELQTMITLLRKIAHNLTN